MKKILLLSFFISIQSFAQVGIGTDAPNNSAILDVTATNKGILFPRMTSSQRTSIPSPVNGLYVFDTNTNSLWFFNGTIWINTTAEASLGDVKSGFQNFDHSGWIKLDGRAINSLNPNQQAVAISLGFTSNLPDATSTYMVQNGASMGSVAGSNSTTLTQANLPNVTFNGSAASAGNHSHTGTTTTNGSHTHSINDPGHTHSQYTYNDDFNNSGGNPPGFTGDSAGFRTWNNIYSSTTGISINSNGNHNHTFTTSTDGAHTHSVTVSSGGSNTPINIAPRSMSVNMFVYLGQ